MFLGVFGEFWSCLGCFLVIFGDFLRVLVKHGKAQERGEIKVGLSWSSVVVQR